MTHELIACKDQKDLSCKTLDHLNYNLDFKKPNYLLISGGASLSGLFKEIISRKLNLKNIKLILSDERLSNNIIKDTNHYNIKKELIYKISSSERPEFIYPYLADLTLRNDIILYFTKLLPISIKHSILGVGEDGHIASIFSKNISQEDKKTYPLIFTKKYGEEFERISFNLNYLINIKFKTFIIEGKQKKNILTQLIQNKISDNKIPFFNLINKSKYNIKILYNEEILN